MSLGNLIFWAANLTIVLGYVTVAAYFATVQDEDGGVSRNQRFAGMAFFFLCATTHIELAVHAITDEPLIGDNVSWHMLLIHVPQAISIWAMIHFVRRCGIVLPPMERRKLREPDPVDGGRRSYDL